MTFKNASSENRFQIIFNDKKELNESILAGNLPDISLNSIITPFSGKNIKISGDSLEIGEIIITFKLDEDYENYNKIYDWLMNNHVYANVPDSLEFDRIEYIILGPNYKPVLSFTFSYCFPTNISEIGHTTQSTGADELEFTTTFQINGIVKNTL